MTSPVSITIVSAVRLVRESPWRTSSVRWAVKRAVPRTISTPDRSSPRSLPDRKLSTIACLRCLTTAMSTPVTSARTPYTLARPATCATLALATIVFVGEQPSLTHVPPTWARSTSAVRRPARANAPASGPPPCPAPITITS